ncbi:hypothetical protein DIC82_08760 [Clostridium beijerinckii]|nr:hypothetical protein DIC82_08760 [Clostridium beijerinckii]
MNKEDIKEIICENIKLTGENIKLGYENKQLKDKLETLKIKLALMKFKPNYLEETRFAIARCVSSNSQIQDAHRESSVSQT